LKVEREEEFTTEFAEGTEKSGEILRLLQFPVVANPN
jgi:hypothetical protein